MSKSIIANTKQSIRRIARKLLGRKDPESFYKSENYLDNYVAHTNWRVAKNPKEAIGGMWEEIGTLQFDFLRGRGLAPEHKMLDLGCGALRGGRRFIRYLDKSNYTGIDISPACIEAANKLVIDEKLTDKAPRLILNETKSMAFDEFSGQTFDYIMAQSVFTHLPQEVISACFENIGKVMHANSAFYFTYWASDAYRQTTLKDFAYPWAFFEELAAKTGFRAAELSNDYPHPRNQKIGCIKKA